MLRLYTRNIQQLSRYQRIISSTNINRKFCEKIEKNENQEHAAEDKKISGFAKAFEKFSQPEEIKEEKLPDLPFATLLRNSNFIDLGDPQNKVVVGKIFHVVDDDLYIDFGWKFHCVCTRPSKNSSAYVRGARVKLRVKELELSTRFLGSNKDLTILEADCQIIGLLSSPAISKTRADQIMDKSTSEQDIIAQNQ